MKQSTAHRLAERGLFSCLLLMLQITLLGQQNCPPYPRAMDQVYVCCGSNAAFEQNASIHNPIRFTFGTFPNYNNYKVEVDFKDGQGYQLCNSGEIKTIAYPAGSSGQITIEWKIFWTTGNPPNEIDHYTSGQHVHQLNFNDEVNYADYLHLTTRSFFHWAVCPKNVCPKANIGKIFQPEVQKKPLLLFS